MDKQIDLLLDNVRILQPDGTALSGIVAVDGSNILYVGAKDGLEGACFARVVDGKGGIVMPGLVNAHTHLGMTVFRGFCNHLPLEEWLRTVWPLEDMLTGEDVYWASLLSMQEMLASGVTCFLDMYFFMEDVARATLASGIRGVLGRGMQAPDTDGKRFHEMRSLHANWNGREGRITTLVAPHSVYTCDEPYLRACAHLAEELDVGVHIHACESRQEVLNAQRVYQCSPLELCERAGLFERPASVAHAVELTERDMDILARHAVSAVHCPGSNLKLGNGIAPVEELHGRGINVALGTDSAASNNNLDVFEEMHVCSLLQKLNKRDAAALPAERALAMGTKNGYRALGLTGGELIAGMPADIVLLRTDAPWFTPGLSVSADIVFAAGRGDVALTMVAGKILYENGQWPTLDTSEIKRHVLETATRLGMR